MMFAFCLRCVAESNRLGWFCRPETKPFIQRTSLHLQLISHLRVQRYVFFMYYANYFALFFVFLS